VESRIVVLPVISSFAYGPFCEDTSGSRCDAAPGVASVVVSRRVLSASGSSANISSIVVHPDAPLFFRTVVLEGDCSFGSFVRTIVR
jgi:hypothetical protein